MQRTTSLRFVTTFHSACTIRHLLRKVGGVSPLDCSQVKTPPEGEVFEDGHAIALASAMTWERTMMRTTSFRSVTTFNKALFIAISSKKAGRPLPLGRRISPRDGRQSDNYAATQGVSAVSAVSADSGNLTACPSTFANFTFSRRPLMLTPCCPLRSPFS